MIIFKYSRKNQLKTENQRRQALIFKEMILIPWIYKDYLNQVPSTDSTKKVFKKINLYFILHNCYMHSSWKHVVEF